MAERGSICSISSLLEPSKLCSDLTVHARAIFTSLHSADAATLSASIALSNHSPTTAQIADILTAAFEIDELQKIEQFVAEAPLLTPEGRSAIIGALALAISIQWGFGQAAEPQVPTVADAKLRALRASAADMDRVRSACFPDTPSMMLNTTRVHGVRDGAAANVPKAEASVAPVALVTIGGNGSGKSSLLRGVVDHVQQRSGGPNAYVDIDPDRFISQLCDNDNRQRALANFCNHESFLYAIGQRRPLTFQGTGKSLETTCSRVIGRLREAGYRVFVVIIIASPATCLRRIEDRRQRTGRAVPDAVVLGTLEALRSNIPQYVTHRHELCERLLLYDNDTEQPALEPTFNLGADDDATAALQLIDQRLRDVPANATTSA